MPFSDYIGSQLVVESLQRMIGEKRLPQTILLAGPRGVGKATLARFLAAALNCREVEADFCGSCSSCVKILALDLSLPEYLALLDERRKLPANKRAENPLMLSTHPDVLVFPPDGPLSLIGIEQARLLRKAARFSPSEGLRRVFHVDHADRANTEAANSLLKTLEEPPPYLTIVLTAENPYELLPTIRSRSVPFYLAPLSSDDMRRFVDARDDLSVEQRRQVSSWSQGSPGNALRMDVDAYAERRTALLTMLRSALGAASYGEMVGAGEALGRRRSEGLDVLIEMLRGLIGDVLHLRLGSGRIVNADIREELRELADRASFEWVERASRDLDDLDEMRRRNVQKQMALEALVVRWRISARTGAYG